MTRRSRCLAVLTSLAVFWMSTSPTFAQSNSGSGEQTEAGSSITVMGVTLHVAPGLGDARTQTVIRALERALEAVPRTTGLPPFSTPVEAYVLESNEAFRAALVEKANVPIERVAEEISGYAIERNGVMLIFFDGDSMHQPGFAAFAFAHELAHLAVREATQRRPVPQWLNEGYAQWTSYHVVREVSPDVADTFEAIDRAVVSSAMHSGTGLLPWASLVTRSRFSRAGTEGWVDLAYGQSTLFVDWLGQRYGRGALAAFLQDLGAGATATPAFGRAFGPFAEVEQDFRVSIETLTSVTPRGARWLTKTDSPSLVLGLLGGSPRDPVQVEVWRDGALMLTREDQLNQAGFGLIPVAPELRTGDSDLKVRIVSTSLGALEIRLDQASVPAKPLPAPVQLPIGLWNLVDRATAGNLAA